MKRVIFIVMIAMLTIAASEEPDWRLELREQIETQEECDLLYITNFRERELGGDTATSGRAHCRDGRNFDFARLKPYLSFEFKACEIQVC